MKILIPMILLMIVGSYGCSTDDLTGDTIEIGDITVEDVEELLGDEAGDPLEDAETVTLEEDAEGDLDSEQDVPTLDVEQEEAENFDSEDEPGLDEDPTNFDTDPLPNSSFFIPQIP